MDLAANPETFDKAVDLVIDYSFSPQASPRLVELSHAQMAETLPHVLHGDFVACDRFDRLDRMGEIAAPTHVICGVDDQLTPVKYSRFMEDAIPGVRLTTVEDAGHMVMLEAPMLVAEAVKAFMDEAFG